MSDNGKVLDRQHILEAQDVTIERIEVPEWGGTVLVRSLTADERDAYENSYLVQKGDRVVLQREHMRARLVAFTVVSEAGDRVFSEGDVIELGKKSARAVDRIYDVASRLSGLSPRDMEELKGN